jgi:hypothetical protein
MMAEQNQKTSSIFLKQFTFALIKAFEKKRSGFDETKIIVDADLIPELSEELMREYLRNKNLLEKLERLDESDFLTESFMKEPLIEQKRKVVGGIMSANKLGGRNLSFNNSGQKSKVQSQSNIGIPLQSHDGENGYEKIRALLEDFSVSRIQCLSPFKPLIIIRSGQKQLTKFGLSQNEIYDVFLYFAEMAHLPLIEGPIKILLNNMEINGINSKLTESKFIIQKKTAYALLEKQGSSSNNGIPMRR